MFQGKNPEQRAREFLEQLPSHFTVVENSRGSVFDTSVPIVLTVNHYLSWPLFWVSSKQIIR